MAEIRVENSLICPTYQLSYESASELLSLDLDDESELSILYEAAALRKKWRLSKVSHGNQMFLHAYAF